jgi:hypothetical protein
MGVGLKRLLYESMPAQFRSAYNIDESVNRLAAVTKRFALSAIGETAVVGKVSADAVRLQRVMPMVRNSFKPFFIGHFETREGVTMLTGHFGMSLFVKIFMSFWLGMVGLFGLIFLLSAVSSTSSIPWWAAIAPLFMFAAGFGLVALGKWFSRNDVAWLSSVIGRALGDPGIPVYNEPSTDPSAVPSVLKGVALFLSVSGVMALIVDFVAPKAFHPSQVSWPLGPWNKVYAAAVVLLAVGVWLRRPWAWWGGFMLLGMSVIVSLLANHFGTIIGAQPAEPPAMRLMFGIFAVIITLVWGRWWYAQRKHFLWMGNVR